MKCILHGTILSTHYIYYFSMTSYPFEFQLITYHCTLHLLYHEIIKLYFWILSMAITLFGYLISVRCLYFFGLNYLLLLWCWKSFGMLITLRDIIPHGGLWQIIVIYILSLQNELKGPLKQQLNSEKVEFHDKNNERVICKVSWNWCYSNAW